MPVRNRGTQIRVILGFDLSYHIARGVWKIRCSQCEALTINGIPTHERGCPNTPVRREEDD